MTDDDDNDDNAWMMMIMMKIRTETGTGWGLVKLQTPAECPFSRFARNKINHLLNGKRKKKRTPNFCATQKAATVSYINSPQISEKSEIK